MPADARTPAPGPQPGTESSPDQQVQSSGHGTSPGAWVSTLGVTFGALLVCIALIFMLGWLIVVGAVVVVVAALSWPVLTRAGLGERSAVREFTGETRAVR